MDRTMMLLPGFPGCDCSEGNAAFVKSLHSNTSKASAFQSRRSPASWAQPCAGTGGLSKGWNYTAVSPIHSTS